MCSWAHHIPHQFLQSCTLPAQFNNSHYFPDPLEHSFWFWIELWSFSYAYRNPFRIEELSIPNCKRIKHYCWPIIFNLFPSFFFSFNLEVFFLIKVFILIPIVNIVLYISFRCVILWFNNCTHYSVLLFPSFFLWNCPHLLFPYSLWNSRITSLLA